MSTSEDREVACIRWLNTLAVGGWPEVELNRASDGFLAGWAAHEAQIKDILDHAKRRPEIELPTTESLTRSDPDFAAQGGTVDLTALTCSRCDQRAEGAIIDLWTNTESYLCRQHMQEEFDAIRPNPLTEAKQQALLEADIVRLMEKRKEARARDERLEATVARLSGERDNLQAFIDKRHRFEAKEAT